MIFKDLFNYFHKKELFTKGQSGFLPDYSCISQLLSIVHDINPSSDCDLTQYVRGIFLDISKAFDKEWHEGFLFKLKTHCVKGELLNLLWNYLHERNQRVLLNGQISLWELIKHWVIQGSVLAPLLFLIYINDLPDDTNSTCKMFADYASLFSHIFDKYKSQSELNNDSQVISNRASQWKMQFNPDPIKQAQEIYMSPLKRKLKIFRIKLALQWLVLFKEHHENTYTMKWALNLYDINDGLPQSTLLIV